MQPIKYPIIYKILLFFIFQSYYGYAQNGNEEKIVMETHQVIGIDSKSSQRLANPYMPDTSQIDFSFLKKALENKRIVILGESSHQDGSTFKMKLNIINYLNHTLNFNTVAFECGSLYGSSLLNHDMNGTRETEDMIKKYGMLAVLIPMWSNAREVIPLDSLFLKKKLNYVGIDCQPNYISSYFVENLKYYIDSIKVNLFSEQEWKSLDSNIKQTLFRYGGAKDTVDYRDIRKQLVRISYFIKSRKPVLNSTGDILIQCIKNQVTYLNELNAVIYESPSFARQGFKSTSKSLNIIRDKQMADNIKWYLDRHPNEKILIWTASFHGCENLADIKYKQNDSITYMIDTVMGYYLYKMYGNDVYSIAFTSYEYADKYTTSIMDTTNTSLEYYLYKTGYNYGYIDCDSIRIKYKSNTPRFKSIILGYSLKDGNWLTAFDGIFYIRRQEESEQEQYRTR
jgi:erythromycin esterase